MIVTENVRNFLWNQRRHGRDFIACAQNLSDWLGEDVSAMEVSRIWQGMIDSGWTAKKRETKGTTSKNGPAVKGVDGRMSKHERQRATLLHLLDLKRAGHSPRRTEYSIAPEGKGVRFATADRCSYLGSSAGMCADVV